MGPNGSKLTFGSIMSHESWLMTFVLNSTSLSQHIREMIILYFLISISEVICASHSRIFRSDAEIPREYWPDVITESKTSNQFIHVWHWRTKWRNFWALSLRTSLISTCLCIQIGLEFWNSKITEIFLLWKFNLAKSKVYLVCRWVFR